MLYPMTFAENRHMALWGHEDWVVSGHHTSPSVVANGPHAGRTLEDLTLEFGRALTGTRAPAADKFPLLFKVIDAHDRLSVQVHPNERTAPVTGGEPKTEMWYVLGHDAPIYAGLKPGTTPEDVSAAVHTGRFEEIVAAHATQPGDVMFIPGGLVHAIGAGACVYEVQQSSNTTYRLYDWGRVGADGRPRTLHVKESLASIDFKLPVPSCRTAVECAFFKFAPINLVSSQEVPATAESFRVYYVEMGSVRVVGGGETLTLAAGAAVLVPAGVPVALVPRPAARLLAAELA